MSNYILSIGISDYEYCAPLSAAVADAREIYGIFKQKLGFEKGVELRNPQKHEVDQEIKNIKRLAKAGDTVVVFIAGHGLKVDGSLLLLFKNTQPPNLLDKQKIFGEEVLSISLLVRQLSEFAGVNILLLLDMCRNEIEKNNTRAPIMGNYFLPKQTLDREEINKLLVEIKTSSRTNKAQIGVMFASADGQPAYELLGQNRGVFSLGLEKIIKEHQELKAGQSLSIGATTVTPLKKKMEQLSEIENLSNATSRQYQPSYVGSLEAVEIHKGQAKAGDPENEFYLLRIKFENQLLKNQIDKPIGDNCVETLGALNRLSCEPNKLAQLRNELEKAKAKAKANANAKVKPDYENWIKELFQRIGNDKKKLILGTLVFSVLVVVVLLVHSTLPTYSQHVELLQVTDCPVCSELVKLPADSFQMGSEDGESYEKPVRPVEVATFEISRTEVTQAQWQAVMGSNPSKYATNGANRPVENVKWNDIQEFLSMLNKNSPGYTYRLPTEAEWEYAAGAGGEGKWSFGDDESKLGEYAWYEKNRKESTQEVATRSANKWGLHDMHGNVWEWVEDGWHDNYKFAPKTGEEWKDNATTSDRILRGGSWRNGSNELRSAKRVHFNMIDPHDDIGFRLVRSATAVR